MDVAALAAGESAAGNAPLCGSAGDHPGGAGVEALRDVAWRWNGGARARARQRLRTGPCGAAYALSGSGRRSLAASSWRTVGALGTGDTLHRASGPWAPGPRPPRAVRWGEPPDRGAGTSRSAVGLLRQPRGPLRPGVPCFASSDRRGLRLQGPALALARRSDIPPEGTALGAVQVPGDGLPIVLGPEPPGDWRIWKIATWSPRTFLCSRRRAPERRSVSWSNHGASTQTSARGWTMSHPALPHHQATVAVGSMPGDRTHQKDAPVAPHLARPEWRIGAHPGISRPPELRGGPRWTCRSRKSARSSLPAWRGWTRSSARGAAVSPT